MIDDARGVYAFVRELDEQRVYVALNRSPDVATVEVPVTGAETLIDWMNPAQADVLVPAQDWGVPRVVHPPGAAALTASDGRVKIELKPYGTAVLAPETDR
jgi:hypothetical protein